MNDMPIKFNLNFEEKFYSGRVRHQPLDDVCDECNNTGHIKRLNLFEKQNSFEKFFEYFKYTTCTTCSTTENKLVPMRHSQKYVSENTEYSINSDGFRSNEFIKEHDSKHILFVGCSHTFGLGTNFENTWGYRVYSKISESENLSGYYNLSHIGAKISESIFNIFLYCKKYAKPDVIFFLMPTIGRELSPKDDMNEYAGDEEIFMNLLYKKQQATNMYMILEEYCISNGIKLISKTWDKHTGSLSTQSTFENFSTFITNNLDVFNGLVIDYCEANKKDNYSMRAKDGVHFGNAMMHAESEIMYNFYKGLK